MPGRHGQYPPELRERAVRLVAECRADHAEQRRMQLGKLRLTDGSPQLSTKCRHIGLRLDPMHRGPRMP